MNGCEILAAINQVPVKPGDLFTIYNCGITKDLRPTQKYVMGFDPVSTLAPGQTVYVLYNWGSFICVGSNPKALDQGIWFMNNGEPTYLSPERMEYFMRDDPRLYRAKYQIKEETAKILMDQDKMEREILKLQAEQKKNSKFYDHYYKKRTW